MITESNSQKARTLAPENDPLEIGMGWTVGDLDKPQIMVESTFGNSHPGSAHLDQFVNQALKGIADAGGKGARCFATDICNDISQGYDGISYSLARRDMIANMIEIHGKSAGFDDGVFTASCDKSVPACLMEPGRLDMPSIIVTEGVMDAGPDLLTLEQAGVYPAMCQRGEITKEKLTYYKHHARPSCDACSFIGTVSTMRVTAEAPGLMFPGSALMPAICGDLKEMAYEAGVQVTELARKGTKASDIVTMKSFEDTIMVYAAASDSTNSLLHAPAIAHEFGLGIDRDTSDRTCRGAHHPLDIRPAGEWPAQLFYYAGGIPAVMEEIKSILHLDVTTVIGKTLGRNLEELKNNGFYGKCERYLGQWGLKRMDVVRIFDQPIGVDGIIAVLRGNFVSEGAAVKHSAASKEMFRAVLRARPLNCGEDAIEAVISKRIRPGDTVFIRYEGSKGSGTSEMFYTTEAISPDPELGKTIAPIMDRRLSGAFKGPAIGHVLPEAAQEGSTALVKKGDLIRISILVRVLKIIGAKGEELPEKETGRALAERKRTWKLIPPKYIKGVLRIFSEHAVFPMKGGYMAQWSYF